MSYPQVKLGDISIIRTGKLDANASSEDGEYYFFTCAKDPLKISTYSYDCECVLVAGNGDLNVKYYSGKFDAYQRTYIIESKDKNIINVRYLFYFLDKYLVTLREQSIGGIIKYIKLANLTDILIPLPPLEEQRRIAEILDKADSLIQKRKESITKLDELLQATFIDLFGDPVTNPKAWDQLELKHFILNGPQNGLYKPASLYGQGTPIIRIDGFKNGDIIDQKEFKRLTIDNNDIDKYKLNKLDFVINRVNSPEYIGKTALIRNIKEDTVFESNMMKFNINIQKLNPYYLLFLLKQQFILNQIASKRKDAVNQSSINQKDVMSLIINIPLIELQDKWEEFATVVEEQKQKLKGQLEVQETLFKSLQQQAFSGQL